MEPSSEEHLPVSYHVAQCSTAKATRKPKLDLVPVVVVVVVPLTEVHTNRVISVQQLFHNSSFSDRCLATHHHFTPFSHLEPEDKV